MKWYEKWSIKNYNTDSDNILISDASTVVTQTPYSTIGHSIPVRPLPLAVLVMFNTSRRASPSPFFVAPFSFIYTHWPV
jgi:hypothetical protein